MTDFLLCEGCETLVSAKMEICPCCRTTFKEFPYTAGLLAFCEFLDDPTNPQNISYLLKEINNSIFKNHPAITFRTARLLTLDALSKPEQLSKKSFFDLLIYAVSASRSGPQYWEVLASLLSKLLPSPNINITEHEFRDIITQTKSSYKDRDYQFAERLAMQITYSPTSFHFQKC